MRLTRDPWHRAALAILLLAGLIFLAVLAAGCGSPASPSDIPACNRPIVYRPVCTGWGDCPIRAVCPLPTPDPATP